MTPWATVPLGECCEIVSGATPSTSRPEFWDGDIGWATPKDLSDLDGSYIHDTPRKLTQAGLDNCSAAILPPHSVLFSSRAPIGHVAINTVPMATNQGFKSFVPDRCRVEPTFLFWWLRSHRQYLESLGNGATFKEVSKAVVSRVAIPLPPLPEQRRIAAILDKADELRAKRQASLTHLNGLTQAVFLEMFGDPTLNSLGWETQPLSHCCTEINDCPHSTPSWAEQGIVCLRTSNVTVGGWNWEDTRYVTEEDYHRRSARGYVMAGDIILSREGTVGIAAIVTPGMTVCMGQRLVQLRPASSVVLSDFMLSVLLYELAPERIGRVMVGATSQHLNVRDLKALRVPVPPLNMQRKYSETCRSAAAVAHSAQGALDKHESLFAVLQHRAFAGEL